MYEIPSEKLIDITHDTNVSTKWKKYFFWFFFGASNDSRLIFRAFQKRGGCVIINFFEMLLMPFQES